MESKKPLTDEELMDLLNNPKEIPELQSITKSVGTAFSVQQFIEDFNLKPGDHYITFDLLYNLRLKWHKEPPDRNHFKNHLKMVFHFNKQGLIGIDLKQSKITDAVVALIISPSKPKSFISLRNRIVQFISINELKKGEFLVPDYSLFLLYNKTMPKKKLLFDNFVKSLKTFFEYKIDKHDVYWFSINKELTFSMEEVKNARKHINGEKKNKTK